MTVGRQSSVGGRQSTVGGRRSSRQATPSILKPKGKPRQWRFNYSDGGQEAACRKSDSRSRQARTSNECKGTYTWENSQSKGVVRLSPTGLVRAASEKLGPSRMPKLLIDPPVCF
jgi:hypothetical protein